MSFLFGAKFLFYFIISLLHTGICKVHWHDLSMLCEVPIGANSYTFSSCYICQNVFILLLIRMESGTYLKLLGKVMHDVNFFTSVCGL